MNNIITKRIDLNLGYSCNADCDFCYYKVSSKSKRIDKDLTTEQAKMLLRYIRKRGKEIVDFTGGEPTIRQDIFELVRYAKQIGFKEVTIITNGIKLSDKEFVKKLIKEGVDDILFSLHGHTKEIHDKLTGIEGSFEKLIQAIKNAKEVGNIRIRSNTVVNGMNFNHVLEITEILSNLGVEHINFILFNPIVEASCKDKNINVKYSEVSPCLKEVVNKYKDKFERITIRYLPFCFMPGYEKFITECPQIQYDEFEWDYFIRMRIRSGWFLALGAMLIGLLLLPNIKRVLIMPIGDLFREAIMRGLSFKNKAKGKVCKECKFDYVCDALWKEYAKNCGFNELKPQKGNKIIEPYQFLWKS